jgi:outer membrane receptor protein involved in Fe transport
MFASTALLLLQTARKRNEICTMMETMISRPPVLRIAFVLACILLVTNAFAQTSGKIAGTIKDATTGETLIGVNVFIAGTTMGAATDIDGAFFILNVPPGEYNLTASMVGYQQTVMSGVIVNAGRTTTADFNLSEAILTMEEVVVRAVRPDVEKEKTSTSAIVRFDEVQSLPGIRDVSDILGLAADVTDGHFRGGRLGEEYYTLQGMGIVNPLDNTSAFLPIMSGVEEVEVITSGFGAQYGNAQSGVVNISMREGRSDRWRTRFESRTRAPGRKHFGPSVYDPQANPYLRLLLSGDVWLAGDPGAATPQPYYGSMGSGLTSSYARDTLVQLAVAQELWRQTRRDLNRSYGNDLDYSVEAATGGPISPGLRMFIALRQNTEWPEFPTEQPDIQYQVMGNIAADLSGGRTFRISGGFTDESANVFPGANSVGGYQRWMWDRITGINYRKRVNSQLGLRFTQALSPSTFYELKLNSLFTNNKMGATPVPGFIPDTLSFSWTTGVLSFPNNNSPDGLNYLIGYDFFRDERTRTISFDGSFTSQVTRSHLLNAGIQLNSYFIESSNNLSVRSNRHVEVYSAHPLEAAAYIQDKMEFEGMIANVGVRFDVWSSGMDYYTDLYTPFLLADSVGKFHPETAPKKESPIIGRLQPRLGVSFPISEGTVFHLNYGSFMQRPSFQYVVSERLAQLTNSPVVLGNPRLEPEVTNSYDIGVMQALGEGFTLDVSGYYKDVKNLLQQANFTDDRAGNLVSSYFNLDYADIRGFRLSLTKRRGDLTGAINYQYSYATGRSATATAATPAFYRDTTGAVTTDLTNVPTRDIILDFDRTHNLVLNVIYTTPPDLGPEVDFLGGYPFGDLAVSVRAFARSGRPYTSPSNIKLINVLRTPAEYNTDLRVTKRVSNFFGVPATFYVEVFNLLDNKILNYSYIFQRPTATNPNLPLQYYERYPVDDPNNGIRYWWDKGRQGPFAVDQSFLIYSNQPRSFSFGLVLEF